MPIFNVLHNPFWTELIFKKISAWATFPEKPCSCQFLSMQPAIPCFQKFDSVQKGLYKTLHIGIALAAVSKQCEKKVKLQSSIRYKLWVNLFFQKKKVLLNNSEDKSRTGCVTLSQLEDLHSIFLHSGVAIVTSLEAHIALPLAFETRWLENGRKRLFLEKLL